MGFRGLPVGKSSFPRIRLGAALALRAALAALGQRGRKPPVSPSSLGSAEGALVRAMDMTNKDEYPDFIINESRKLMCLELAIVANSGNF